MDNVRWEYTMFQVSGRCIQESEILKINQLGAQGWELVTAQEDILIFKRRLP